MYKRFLLIGVLLIGSGCVHEKDKVMDYELDIVASDVAENVLTSEQSINLIGGGLELEEINALVEENELTHLDLDFIASGYRSINEFDLAEKSLKEAVELDETFGDHYGNLISLYVELEKFDEAEKMFNTAIEKAIFGREFVYFHQTRAFLTNGNVLSATSTCIQGIEEMEQLREFIAPYEDLYFACIKSLEVLISQQQDQNLSEDTISETAEKLSNILLETAELFPNSERVQEVYDYYMEEE